MVLGEIQDGINKNKISLFEYKKNLNCHLNKTNMKLKNTQLKRDMRKG